mmetsp:Transcript_143867/g.460559  ORF Transcript_143867/g.460559 Transcript_143867/m.460559 type:complete len:256 (-) Transcript_143867:460-1227(-)
MSRRDLPPPHGMHEGPAAHREGGADLEVLDARKGLPSCQVILRRRPAPLAPRPGRRVRRSRRRGRRSRRRGRRHRRHRLGGGSVEVLWHRRGAWHPVEREGDVREGCHNSSLLWKGRLGIQPREGSQPAGSKTWIIHGLSYLVHRYTPRATPGSQKSVCSHLSPDHLRHRAGGLPELGPAAGIGDDLQENLGPDQVPDVRVAAEGLQADTAELHGPEEAALAEEALVDFQRGEPALLGGGTIVCLGDRQLRSPCR